MTEGIEVRMVDVAHRDKVWRDNHKVMMHTKKIEPYYIVYIYTYSLIHTSEGSVVMARWISAFNFGLSIDVDDAFSSYPSKKKEDD
jgi:hypothetical protein